MVATVTDIPNRAATTAFLRRHLVASPGNNRPHPALNRATDMAVILVTIKPAAMDKLHHLLLQDFLPGLRTTRPLPLWKTPLLHLQAKPRRHHLRPVLR